jgi:hypothetical protein
MDTKYPADPFAGSPSFTGSFVSETFVPEKKGYRLILRSDSGVTKEFFSSFESHVDRQATRTNVIVRYKTITDKKTKKPVLLVLDCKVTEGVSQEYIQEMMKKAHS